MHFSEYASGRTLGLLRFLEETDTCIKEILQQLYGADLWKKPQPKI